MVYTFNHFNGQNWGTFGQAHNKRIFYNKQHKKSEARLRPASLPYFLILITYSYSTSPVYADIPSLTFTTWKPSSVKISLAVTERLPLRQMMIYFSSGSNAEKSPFCKADNGALIAPGM